MADRPNQCKRNVAVCCAVVFTAAACGGGEPDQVPTSVRTDSAPSTSALPIDGQAEATAQSPQAAALRFVASTDKLLGHSAIGRRQILTALIAPGALPAQEQALADAVERIATTLGVPVERLIWVEAPLTSTVRTVDADRAVVDVWTVSVLGVPGAGSPQQVWRTVHVSLAVVRRSLAGDRVTGRCRSDSGSERVGVAGVVGRVPGRRRLAADRRGSGTVTGVLAVGWPWDPIVDLISKPFEAAAGWAWDTVIGGITDWLGKGFVQLVTFVWEVMDRTSSPRLTSEWFSGSAGAPYLTAVGVATGLLGIFVFCALIQGVIAGRPMELVQRMAVRHTGGRRRDPVHAGVRPDRHRPRRFDLRRHLGPHTGSRRSTPSTGSCSRRRSVSGQSFLGPLLLLIGMLGMLMLWIVLFVRDALIYLVVALAPMAWATSVWPAIASVRRRVLELLAALIFSKLAIAMALAVGLGALGGVGATGNPGEPAIDNGLAEFGTLVAGSSRSGLRRSCRSS